MTAGAQRPSQRRGGRQDPAACKSNPSVTGPAQEWRGAGDPGGAQLRASTDGGAQRQDPAACTLTSPFGVYIHIPFCVAKCRYCDFASRPLTPGALEPYLAALEQEIAAAPESGRPVGTIFIGGGTPSLLSGGQLSRVLGALRSRFAVDPGAEVTVEVNPGTLTAGKAGDFRALGVNRVSLGAQSFDDDLLVALGRGHSSDRTREAWSLLRSAGFDNLGLDLIHGLPGQTPELWRRDLTQAIDLSPEHLSLYELSVEQGTALAADLQAGRLALPGEDQELEMLALAHELTASAGYERYEISNFARPTRRCRHNLDVWRLGSYRGFGAAAHSFLREPIPQRLANTPDTGDYVRRVSAGTSPVATREQPTARQLAGEALMLGLRTRDGVDEAGFAGTHGAHPAALFPEAVALGAKRCWLEHTAGSLRLTPEGVLFSNVLFRLLF